MSAACPPMVRSRPVAAASMAARHPIPWSTTRSLHSRQERLLLRHAPLPAAGHAKPLESAAKADLPSRALSTCPGEHLWLAGRCPCDFLVRPRILIINPTEESWRTEYLLAAGAIWTSCLRSSR